MRAKLIKNPEGYDTPYILTNMEDILIASTEGKLSLKNCQVIEDGYDLDEIIEQTKQTLEDSRISSYDSFRIGMETILKILGDKKFSEYEAYVIWKAGQEYWKTSGESITFEELIEKRKDLLKQTEWDVEICNIMDCIGGNLCNGTSFECNHCTNTGELKLDADGCLILKRI